MKQLSVAILGAGIMGSSTALELARRGHRVVLFDAAAAPLTGASRWNEGKIHLGFIYSADPSLATARKVIPGGLMFRPLVERLLGCPLPSVITPDDDLTLCHRDSVVPHDSMEQYLKAALELVRQHPDARNYLGPVERVQRLSARELASITDSPEIIAGFRVPERSVSTTWIADAFVRALEAQPLIEQRMNTAVTAVRPTGPTSGAPWEVLSSNAAEGPFDCVINALWHGRMAVDLSAGIRPRGVWSNRYRLALFVRTIRPLDVLSTIVATGPFGDVKNYGDRDFYVSWYPLGLMVDSQEVLPTAPPAPHGDAVEQIATGMLERLGACVPAVRGISENVESMRLEGGWVHAAGTGLLSDRASTLHQRTDFGVVRYGNYISVDTGKYSTAPWLAQQIADMVH